MDDHKLTAAEALYGFTGWLTSRSSPVTLSRVHDAAIAADLVAEFCKANGIGDVSREDWHKFLKHPEDKPTRHPITQLPIFNGDHAEFEREHANTPKEERPDWPYPSFDARDWAKAFCKINASTDIAINEDTML